MASNHRSSCLNCRAPLSDRFCARCGQDSRLGRLSFRQVLSDTADELFKLELPIARTVTQLAWRPGWVATSYVEGRRRDFTNPLKYCLLITAISVIVLQIWSLPEIDAEVLMENGEPDEFQAAWFDAMDLVQDWSTRYAAIVTLLLLPVLAGLSRLAFLRSGRNFAEHCVLGLYIHGQWYLITLLITPFILAGAGWALLASQLLVIVLYAFGAIQFFPGRKWINAVLGFLVGFFYLVTIYLAYQVAAYVLILVRTPEVFTAA